MAETLVCIGIAGVLVSMLLPAVQSARESGRAVQCKNNLRQVGIALHSFEGARQRFPQGGDILPDGMGTQWPRAHAPHLYLLPYLDGGSIYSRINLAVASDRTVGILSGSTEANEEAKQTWFSQFLCPSDAGGPLTRNNYRANIGVTAFPRYANVPPIPPLPGNGAFYPVEKPVFATSFRDGLSNTVGFSEKLGGSGEPARYSPARDFFLVDVTSDVKELNNSPHQNTLYVEACASLTTLNPAHDSTAGQFWFYAGLPDTWYNHLLTPNHPTPDCGYSEGMFSSGVMTARSAHPGGVNCLMMDGAVRLFSNSVASRVWQSIATRDGADPVNFE